jgi:glycosyltransferase involved in cell wall biosynthesis
MRILLSAYYCSPYRGGESAVGWNVAARLAKNHEVTVICGDLAGDSPTGKDIERCKREQDLPPGLEIQHLQAEGLARTIHDLHVLPGLWFLYYEAYRRWQLQALELARRLHAEKPFDLVHHVTVIGFREPGYLWQLGIPFFWGPVSGAPMVPAPFLRDFGWKERFRWATRNFMNACQIRRGGRPARAVRAARMVWTVGPEDREVLSRWGADTEPMLEGGTDVTAGLARIRQRGPQEPLRICWSGLFQGIKALPVLLRAIATLPPDRMVLEILGDGPEAARWKSLASSLGLDAQIQWHGLVPRAKALEVMDRCHVLVHTSVKEATATVVMEALERGMPVICHDACGMSTAINDSCGIKVRLSDPATSEVEFRAALLSLLHDAELLRKLSEGARDRAWELQWDLKAARMNEVFLACACSEGPGA